jgi:carbonic anhydrase
MISDNLSPAEALVLLKEGNQRFVQNQRLTPNLMDQVRETASGQNPFAAILGCIDSRAVPELIFDQGIGSLFTIRVAGNVIDEDVLASLEYACTVSGTRLILVKGHTRCGAVQSACQNVAVEGNLKQLMDKLKPCVDAAAQKMGGYADGDDFRDEVSHINVEQSVAQILAGSPILRKLSDRGEIAVVGALYDVRTGKVSFFE